MYPVEAGENLEAAVLLFLTRCLKLPADRTCDLVFTAKALPERRPRQGQQSAVKNEVLVVFESVEQRDEVKSYSKNLQGQEDSGINIKVPYHLKSNFANLRDLAFRMKQKNASFRRNIRYDDRTLDLVMDFTTGNSKWTSVTAADARVSLARRKKSSCTQQELDEVIGTSDVDSAEEEN